MEMGNHREYRHHRGRRRFFSRAGVPTFLLLTTLTSIPAIIFLAIHAFESRTNSDGEPSPCGEQNRIKRSIPVLVNTVIMRIA